METVYTTYFESTKTESNDFTGCLGLGSKTPMSYTDSFTVISRFDGEKITYNIFLNQNGIPSIARLHQEPTTEHNGLEVVVPVKEKDFNEFRLKAQQIFKRFQNPPEIIGNSNYKLEPVTHSMHGEGWALRSPVDEYNQGSAVAVMGSVGYRIVLSDSTLTDIQERALDLPVDLFFKIGEVDVNAGREGLSFDAPTVANIKNRLDSMVIELRDLVSKKFDACTTLWEARCLHYDIFTGEYKPLSSIIKEKNCIIWNGHELSHHEIHHHSAVNIRLFQNEKHVESTYRRRCNRKATIRDGKSVDGIAPRTNTIFVLDDDSTKLYRRCSYYCERNSETNLYLLTPSVVIPDPNSSVVPLTPLQQVDKLVEELGITHNQIVTASTLDLPIRAPRNSFGKAAYASGYVSAEAKARVLRLKDTVYHTDRSNWATDTIDLKDGGIYVEICRYKVVGTRRDRISESSRDLREVLCEEMEEAGLSMKGVNIYGVKSAFLPRLKSNPKWVSLEEYVTNRIQKTADAASANIGNAQAMNRFENGKSNFAMKSLMTLQGKVNKNKTLGKYLEAYATMRSANVNPSMWLSFVELAEKFGITVTPKPMYDLEALQDDVIKAYPMLGVFGNVTDKYATTKAYLTQIEEYVNFLD